MAKPSEVRAAKRPADVCLELDIQPYVLKFWESEFPQLGRRVGPKRLYGPSELDLAREIKRLLQEDGMTLAEARHSLEDHYVGLEAPDGDAEAGSEPLAVAEDVQQRVVDAERRVNEWRNELNRAFDRITALEAQLAAAEGEKARLASAAQESRERETAQAAADRAQIESLRAELAERLAGVEREREVLVSGLKSEQEQLIATLQNERDDAARRARELAQKLEDAQRSGGTERRELKATVDETLADVHALAAEIDALLVAVSPAAAPAPPAEKPAGRSSAKNPTQRPARNDG